MRGVSYDVATALWQGARPYQEDTLLADFHGGMDRGFAILADGMGGHAAGDLASRLVVIDAASHLKFLMHDGEALEKSLAAELTSAIKTANDVLKDRAADDRRLHGMGTTFLATVLFEDRLYWASVGDSPLYLWREGGLRQLNEDHSMAPVIDQMAAAGEITAEEAANHPDRNALTSVLMGSALKAVDVPNTATVLDPGDVLIQASDGLQYLEDAQISDVVARGGSSRQIADALMNALRDLDDPGQDNAAILVLQLAQTGGGEAAVAPLSTATTKRTESPPAAPARAATPTDIARPAGARRWVVPAGVLGTAVAVAGALFLLPAFQNGPEAGDTAPFETAALTAPEAPAPVVAPASPAPAAASIARSLASPAPVAAEASAADVHEIVGETAVAAATPPARIIGDKLANSVPPQATPTTSSATIQFAPEAPGDAPLPGVNAIGLDALTTPETSPSEGISAPDPIPTPQSQRIFRPVTEPPVSIQPQLERGLRDGQ